MLIRYVNSTYAWNLVANYSTGSCYMQCIHGQEESARDWNRTLAATETEQVVSSNPVFFDSGSVGYTIYPRFHRAYDYSGSFAVLWGSSGLIHKFWWTSKKRLALLHDGARRCNWMKQEQFQTRLSAGISLARWFYAFEVRGGAMGISQCSVLVPPTLRASMKNNVDCNSRMAVVWPFRLKRRI